MNADPETFCYRLTPYKTRTVVYCGQFLHFLASTTDASFYDIEDAQFPPHRWCPLSFDHSGGVSNVNIFAGEEYLAGQGRPWIAQLGLNGYCDEWDTEVAQGLTGDFGILIALIASSCRAYDLDGILTVDRAWHQHRWRGHSRDHGSMQRKPT